MSLHDYEAGAELMMNHPPFYALIQAAMRRADTDDLEKLIRAWPEVWQELQKRYNAPSGLLPGEVHNEKEVPS